MRGVTLIHFVYQLRYVFEGHGDCRYRAIYFGVRADALVCAAAGEERDGFFYDFYSQGYVMFRVRFLTDDEGVRHGDAKVFRWCVSRGRAHFEAAFVKVCVRGYEDVCQVGDSQAVIAFFRLVVETKDDGRRYPRGSVRRAFGFRLGLVFGFVIYFYFT